MPASLLLHLLLAPALAGGGPANVLVITNAEDPEAMALAEAYLAARAVPRGHLCALSGLDPAADAIGHEDYLARVLEPTLACRAALPQPEEISTLVLTRGLPYRVDLPAWSVSLDAALQVLDARDLFGAQRLAGQPQASTNGLYHASVENPAAASTQGQAEDFTLSNPYMGWYLSTSGLTRAAEWPAAHDPALAGRAGGWDLDGELMVVGRLDGFSYADGHALIDRALEAERARPEGQWLCMAAADSARGARDPECELATRRLTGLGLDAAWLEAHDPALAGRRVVAYFTGAADLTGAIDGQDYAPGAIVDNLTSFGAVPGNFRCSEDGLACPAAESQTSIARFVRAGATGAHGAVAEPLNNCFPNAAALLLYAAGYSMGEAWLYSAWHLYWQDIWLGDPLTTPWLERPAVRVGPLAEGQPLVIEAEHPRGVAALRLYVDGVLTAEAEGDRLTLDLHAAEGEQLALLAVATAADAPAQPQGWPLDEVLPRPAVQGWTAATLTVAAPVDTGEPAPDTGLAPDPGGCGGCGGGPPAPAPALLALLALRRRRDNRPSGR